MISYFIISLTAFGAAMLTFFSGFGLGTLLAPVMMLFFPAEIAIALTGVVHLFNNFLKLALTARFSDKTIILKFGIAAIISSFIGAWILLQISEMPQLFSYTILGSRYEVSVAKFVIAVMLICFAVIEMLPFFEKLQFDQRWLPIGGALSGFFGGLTGTQGALRSAFLIRSGLSKTAFIGTTAVISTFVDLTRIGVYAQGMRHHFDSSNTGILVTAILSAAAGALLGNQMLKKVTIDFIKKFVAFLLVLIALGLGSGLL